jgi:hypothetical protein
MAFYAFWVVCSILMKRLPKIKKLFGRKEVIKRHRAYKKFWSTLAAWHSSHRVRHQSRRSRVGLRPGCKVYRPLCIWKKPSKNMFFYLVKCILAESRFGHWDVFPLFLSSQHTWCKEGSFRLKPSARLKRWMSGHIYLCSPPWSECGGKC